MIDAKIFLLIFVWPEGQSEDNPRWMSDAYLTVESCEESALRLKTTIATEYGSDARLEHFCFHADDRLNK